MKCMEKELQVMEDQAKISMKNLKSKNAKSKPFKECMNLGIKRLYKLLSRVIKIIFSMKMAKYYFS